MVYPRVYGESRAASGEAGAGAGLSPRVRGILDGVVDVLSRFGSIPACTGNPQNGVSEYMVIGVYPRVYGES